jgi:hypothetical protein
MNEVHKAKKLAKLVAMAKFGSTKKLPKMLTGDREKTTDPLTWKVGKEGHQQGRSLPKGRKHQRTLSKCWDNFDPLLIF